MSRRSAKYDLTQGGILNKLLLVALPVMGTQLMQMSYNLTDMFWLGRVGSGAVAASGTAGMFLWLSGAFMMIGRMGAEIGVSQSLGRDDLHHAKRYAQNALCLAALLGIAYALFLLVLGRPLIGFFNIQEPHVALQARRYLLIVSAGIPCSFLTSSLTGSFTASGNSRTPFLVNAAGLVCNMILDPLMIFGVNLGIAGAAIATVLSQCVSCLLMLAAMKKDKNRPFERFAFFKRPALRYIRPILKWSVPICIENMMFTLLSMVTSRFVAGFGTNAMAVSRVGSQIESLTWLIGGGYGSALTAFTGQNFGAGKWERIHRGFSLSTAAMFVWGLAVTALVFFFGGFLFSIFLPDPDIVAMGATYLRILAICQIPQCFEAVAGSSFKGIGRTLPPSVVSVGANLFRVVLTYALSRTSMGLVGIWWGISLSACLRGLWGFVWYLLYARRLPKQDIQPGYGLMF